MAQHPQALTANRLRTGDVVYWCDGVWVSSLDEATLLTEKPAAEAALGAAGRDVAGQLIVAPYLFEVRVDGAVRRPVKEREIIRAAGPSVRVDLGKQAHNVPL